MNALTTFSESDFNYLEKAIVTYFKNNTHVARLPKRCALPKFTGRSAWNNLLNCLGLAYTSSGSWAGYFVCNLKVCIDADEKWTIGGFGIEVSGRAFAWVQNKEEQEIYLYI